jgi:hypothetical protein
VHSPPLGQRKLKRWSWPSAPGDGSSGATRLEKRGEREMRAIRLLREASAQILYLIAQIRGKCCRRMIQQQPTTFKSRSLPRLSQYFLVKRVMELHLHTASICFPHMTS